MTPADRCVWIKAWVGRCTAAADESGLCADHQARCRACGKPATHDCHSTLGPLVCGTPLCDGCECPADKSWGNR